MLLSAALMRCGNQSDVSAVRIHHTPRLKAGLKGHRNGRLGPGCGLICKDMPGHNFDLVFIGFLLLQTKEIFLVRWCRKNKLEIKALYFLRL